jgi:SAF domain
MTNVHRLHPDDDVATTLVALPRGGVVRIAGPGPGPALELTLADDIPAGHKFALRALPAGSRVRKYGEAIGVLRADASAGAWVHEHNLASDVGPSSTRAQPSSSR